VGDGREALCLPGLWH